MDWIESGGGPFILLGQSLMKQWAGADGPEPGPTDYERAAAVRGWLGALPVGKGHGLVLWGEPLPTALWLESNTIGGTFVRWVAAEDEEAVSKALTELPEGLFAPSGAAITLDDSSFALFDAAMPGSDILTPSIRMSLLPGRYRVDTAEYAQKGKVELVLHRLVLM